MLKTCADVDTALKRLYARVWAEEAAGKFAVEWPQRIALGTCTKSELEENFSSICACADQLRTHVSARGLQVEYVSKLVGGTKQRIPSHVLVSDMLALAQSIHQKANFERAVERAQCLFDAFSELSASKTASLLRKMEKVTPADVDFNLAVQAALWFRNHDASGLTARQIPLEGFHAKWLDVSGRRDVVAELAGLATLELKERPPLVRFTYLDPDYLSSGDRRFDSWVRGDTQRFAYKPDVVVICENRDSALWFPEVPRGIAVMGDGFAGVHNVTALPAVHDVSRVVYWGDIDAAGFEILSGYRTHGLALTSMLMDADTFERYERFGTHVDKNGRTLAPKQPVSPLSLTDAEHEMYLTLIDSSWTRVRRIEQERIPLDVARDVLAALL